tara:strand:+ start:352 stop:660 length:309 start_codon:yes stop_codon:yes gene_type:complete
LNCVRRVVRLWKSDSICSAVLRVETVDASVSTAATGSGAGVGSGTGAGAASCTGAAVVFLARLPDDFEVDEADLAGVFFLAGIFMVLVMTLTLSCFVKSIFF